MCKKKLLPGVAIGYGGLVLLLFLLRWVSRNLLPTLPVPALLVLRIVFSMMLALPAACVLLWEKAPLSEYGFSREKPLRQILTGIAIGLFMSLILTLLPCLLGLGSMVYQGDGYHSLWYAIYELVYFIVAIGFVEEFVFRGFLHKRFSRHTLSWFFPAFFSSVLFGLVHLVNGSPVQVITTTCIGLFFCWCSDHIPGCTILSLAIAHGLHDWLIRVICSIL